MALYGTDSTLKAERRAYLADSLAPGEWQELLAKLGATEEGYAEVSLHDEATDPAYFDDLRVRILEKAVQENHYDPWGFNLVGIESEGNPTHRFQFNGKQKVEALGLHVNDHGARWLSLYGAPDWWQMDPQAERMPWMSPYAFCFGNPINFFDPDGELPTRAEAALMAKHVYGDNVALTGGWRPSAVQVDGVKFTSTNGFKSAMYERVDDCGEVIEYVYAFAGTDDRKDAALDVSQALWGAGANSQYGLARDNSVLIKNELGNVETTAIGHSLGGGLSNTAAYATGWNSLTFNAAAVTKATLGRLGLKGRTLGGQSAGYVFGGDIVNYAQGLLRSDGFIRVAIG